MALLTVVFCQAQLLPNDSTRYGDKDPKKAIELYKYVFSKSSPIIQGNETKPIDMDFYVNFKRLTDLAPYVNYYFYSGYFYQNPTSMYPRMLDSISDPAVRVMLVEDVIERGKMFVDNLDSINVVREQNSATKGDPLTLALAKIKYAHYNYMFAHNPKYYPAHLYDKENAYKLYRDAFKEFLESKDAAGTQSKELEGFYVNEYYRVCEDLYKVDEEKYYEQFLTDYQEIVQVCDKLLIPCYDDPDSLKNYSREQKYVLYRDYLVATYGINPENGDTIGVKLLFANSGAGSADRLKKYFAPRLASNINNKEFLDNAIDFMYANEFTNDTVFYDYCQASYDLGKTFANCIGMGASAEMGWIDRNQMRKYYLEALESNVSEEQNAVIRFLIARSYFSRPPSHTVTGEDGRTKSVVYGLKTDEYKRWEMDVNSCHSNLEFMLENKKALLNSQSLEVRNYVALAYYMMGDNNYQLARKHFIAKLPRLALDYATEALKNFKKAKEFNFQPRPINGINTNLNARLEVLEESTGIDKDGKKLPGLVSACKLAVKSAKDQAEYDRIQAEREAAKEAERRFWNQGRTQ